MNQFHFKPLTLGLLTASVLTLAGLGLFATRTQAADAPKAAAAPKAALTVSTVQAKSSFPSSGRPTAVSPLGRKPVWAQRPAACAWPSYTRVWATA